MSKTDIIPLSTSAYLADTQQLSLVQHGAYLLILMTMWRAGGWIDDDERKLANVCKTTVKKWRQIAPDVRALLLSQDGRLSQKRLLSEMEKALKTVEVNKQNGRSGGIAKALKNKETSLATATFSLDVRQNEEDSPTSFLSTSPESVIKKERKKGSGALPVDWKPSPDELAYGAELGLTEAAMNGMAEDMRLWARANANRAVGRKADWSSTFKGWMRREAAKRGGSNGKQFSGQRPQTAEGIVAAARRRAGAMRGDGQTSGREDAIPPSGRMDDGRGAPRRSEEPTLDLDLNSRPGGRFP